MAKFIYVTGIERGVQFQCLINVEKIISVVETDDGVFISGEGFAGAQQVTDSFADVMARVRFEGCSIAS